MGSGCRYKCLKCGYSFMSANGVGFLFPVVYEETIQKAKAGELGEVIKLFSMNILTERLMQKM